jgi:ribonuclease HI
LLRSRRSAAYARGHRRGAARSGDHVADWPGESHAGQSTGRQRRRRRPRRAESADPGVVSARPYDHRMSVQLEIWCDGACSHNPGPGGWAAILIARNASTGDEIKRRELSDGSPRTTNNEMELTAALKALETLERPARVAVHVDSSYLMNGFAKGWVRSWQRNGWKTAAKQPVAHRALWEELDEQIARHEVEWVKVKGHAGVALNDEVDRLAATACVKHGGHRNDNAPRPARGAPPRRR